MGTRNPIPTTCPKCWITKDGFEFVLMTWRTTSGKEKKGMVCTNCYDREMALREKLVKYF